MAPHIPALSWRSVVRTFERMGYVIVRQKGSHLRLHHPSRDPLTIPRHSVIGRGLMRKLLRDACCTIDEFRNLL